MLAGIDWGGVGVFLEGTATLVAVVLTFFQSKRASEKAGSAHTVAQHVEEKLDNGVSVNQQMANMLIEQSRTMTEQTRVLTALLAEKR